MATIAKLLTDLAKKAKLTEDDTKAINNIIEENKLEEVDLSLEIQKNLQSGLHSIESARSILEPSIKKEAKAELLNGIDASILQALEAELTEKELGDIKAEDSTKKRLEIALKIIKTKKPTGGGDNDAKVQALTHALELSKADLRAKDKEKADAISELEAKHKASLFGIALDAKVLGRQDVAKESRESRHFITNFKADFDDYLKENGIKVNPDTFELNTLEDTPYYDKTNSKVTFDDLLGNVIKKYGYEKKSVTPEVEVYRMDNNGITEKVDYADLMA